MAETVKLKDIAQRMDISVVTVSNALSGKKGVSDSVREEILAVAEEMGYDLSKYEKREKEHIKIAVIVSEKYLGIGTSFYWAMYQQVTYAVSRKQGYTMFEIIPKNVNNRRELPRVIQEEPIDGIIIIGRVDYKYMERILAAAKVPVVLLDFYKEGLACDAVLSSNYIGMYKVTRYLLERGHRDIAFVGSRAATENINDRYYGFRKAMEEWKQPVKPEWILEDRNIENGDMKAELPEKMPTAFVCSSDLTAGVIYDKLKSLGYRVPEDISIVGYDNYLYGHPFAQKLTTYNVDMEKMAGTAVHILLNKIRKKGRRRGVRYIDSGVIERSSVRNLNI
ncbi:MAG: LacI family DNA-binding transcriptional regulator [Lachnospiraceae bacterium]|nr:LacI family DNA-binding transcriptional regulator [Lachnospiraceae bacterium]